LRQRHFLAFCFPGFMMPPHGFDQSPARRIIGLEDFPCSPQKTPLIFFTHIGKKLSIFGDRLQQFSGQSQSFFKMIRHRGRRNISILTDAGGVAPLNMRSAAR
jgi:hypothetical protein